ncbi:hypothetical protein CLV30_109104 [Haloactinopolyspora alba]|uniref:Antitoxin FitA-like ribbon-helix-helix domain-containing protein n=1 Tax=Haloactinopolyspora alba TaxID=648780 RepID=A0A2P8E056_9ACTN|nr:hypothetical protein [Haloactinopolyspora alba]PSL02797.1 hypothetical protein CLV30_109104 [Haloactinopolyspora alba]
MTVALQIRDVPDEVRDTLASVAAERGKSMQAYLLEVISREARLSRNRHVFDERASQRTPLDVDEIVETIRAGRDGPEK